MLGLYDRPPAESNTGGLNDFFTAVYAQRQLNAAHRAAQLPMPQFDPDPGDLDAPLQEPLPSSPYAQPEPEPTDSRDPT